MGREVQSGEAGLTGKEHRETEKLMTQYPLKKRQTPRVRAHSRMRLGGA